MVFGILFGYKVSFTKVFQKKVILCNISQTLKLSELQGMIHQNLVHERLQVPGPPHPDPSCDPEYACIAGCDNEHPQRKMQSGIC